MTAPVEYIIIGFPENDFSGEIVPELAALVESGTIRILDLVFIARGDDGSVIALEVDEDENLSAFAELDAGVGGVISEADIEHAAESIAEGSSVLLIVWEDLWAEPLAGALRRAGGEVLEGGRIPADLIDESDAVLAES
jgi:hypothetical protein